MRIFSVCDDFFFKGANVIKIPLTRLFLKDPVRQVLNSSKNKGNELEMWVWIQQGGTGGGTV